MTEQSAQTDFFKEFAERHHFWTPAQARIVLAIVLVQFVFGFVLSGLGVTALRGLTSVVIFWVAMEIMTRQGSFIAAVKGNYQHPSPVLAPGESALAMKIRLHFYAGAGCCYLAVRLFEQVTDQMLAGFWQNKPFKLELPSGLSVVLLAAAIGGVRLTVKRMTRLLQDWHQLDIQTTDAGAKTEVV